MKKVNSRSLWLPLLLAAALLVPTPAAAIAQGTEPQAKTQSPELVPPQKFLLGFMLGASYWPNIGDIRPDPSLADPEQFGRFGDWGGNFEFPIHGRVATIKGVDLMVGGEVGVFFGETKEDFEDTTQDFPDEQARVELEPIVSYVTASTKLRFGKPDSWRPFLGAGLGFYLFRIKGPDKVFPVNNIRTGETYDELFPGTKFFGEDSLGGYLSAGVDVPLYRSPSFGLMLRTEYKLHFAKFEDIYQFAPGSDDLTGPIHMLQVGIVFGK